MQGAAYAGKSKLRVLLGDEILRKLAGMDGVVDFGCGDGAQAVELAQLGCRNVIGVDIRPDVLEAGRARATAAGVQDRCRFTEHVETRADAVVSVDAFEHFCDPEGILRIMHSLLKPGGAVFASFGPTWYHPLGGHMFSIFPWAHLLFTEKALCAWRLHLRDDGATCFSDVEGGLNRMTIGRFENIVKNSPFAIERLECVPIRRFAALHNRATREWITATVRATLRAR
jgi:SAM-dependent methyltransferase